MKNRRDIEKILRQNKSLLKRKFKVEEIGIFGSCIRGEMAEKSDVDIMVSFSEPIGWEFIDLKEFLETILETPVDLVTRKALKPQLREAILNEVVYT